MKIENQVCTLEQAKRLKELGVKQSSLFYWIDRREQSKIIYSQQVEFMYGLPVLSAFTVAELGVMLPCYIDKENHKFITTYKSTSEDGFYCSDDEARIHADRFDTEAQARASMLIHLLENNLISVDEINARL